MTVHSLVVLLLLLCELLPHFVQIAVLIPGSDIVYRLLRGHGRAFIGSDQVSVGWVLIGREELLLLDDHLFGTRRCHGRSRLVLLLVCFIFKLIVVVVVQAARVPYSHVQELS